MTVTLPLLLAGSGVVALIFGGALFVRRIVHVSMPRGSRILMATATVSMSLSGAGLGLAWLGSGPWLGVLTLAALPLLLGPVLMFLETQRRVPVKGIQVAEGDCLLPFEARRPDSTLFHSDELRGQRVLLKFFRGHWCPFCSAELRELDAIADGLARHGVTVLALSKDTPEQAHHHAQRDGLRLQLLSDADLTVIRRYGIEHRKAFEMSGGRLSILGFPIGRRPRFESMAAPTTLLIDEDSRIRWLDQTDDYHVRSDRTRILAAVQAAFGTATHATTAADPSPRAVPKIAPCY